MYHFIDFNCDENIYRYNRYIMTDEIKVLIVIVLAIIIVRYVYSDTFDWLFSNNSDKQTENFGQTGNINNVLKDEDNADVLNGEVDINKPVELNNASYGDNYFIDIGEIGTSLANAMCSKSCCSPQYPVPFSLPTDKMVCNSGEKYVSSGITCNNGFQDTGCLCMTEDQAMFLATRGQNA